MDRLELREINQKKGLKTFRTSGSTGTVVFVEKYKEQLENFKRHSKLIKEWYQWNENEITLKVNPVGRQKWLNYNYFESNKFENIGATQLISWPSFFPEDFSNFNRIISYGEPWNGIGYDLYSSEEFGFIASQCPNNKNVLHIMDNFDIVFREDGLHITDLTHPYLKDYVIGDWAEKAECNCGINLPAMTHVKGRIRNFIKMPDGTSKFPMFGLFDFMSIKRFQIFQETLTKLRVHIDGIIPEEALNSIRKTLGYDFEIEVVYGKFKNGKHEEFICEI